MDDSGPNIVRGGTHGQCRRGESGSAFTGGAWHPDMMLSSTSCRRARHPLGKRFERRAAWNQVAPRRGTDTGRAGTLHFAAEDSVTDEHTLSLGANLLLWGFPLVLVILVVAETLLDTWWREPRR